MLSPDPHGHSHDQRMLQAIVDYQGFALFHVADRPPLTHTIGLYSPDNGRPELLISGLSVHRRVEWMLDLGFQVNGPPSRRAREEASEATGIPLAEFVYPAGGTVFTPGVSYFLAQSELPGCFGVVDATRYDDLLWHARAYHGVSDVPVLQFVWSDRDGRFPWDPGYNQRRYPQHVLFDPAPLLPLQPPTE